MKKVMLFSRARRKSTGCGGFTLIELAIVTLISGILMAAAMDGYTTWLKQKKVNQQIEQMATIQTAIAAYINSPGHKRPAGGPHVQYLPCPASLTLPEGDPDYGYGGGTQALSLGNACTGNDPAPPNTQSGKPPLRTPPGPPGPGPYVRIGALPVRDLGLSNAYSVNPWGYKYIYAVTETEAGQATGIYLGPGNGLITVTNEGLGKGYVVVDPGMDGVGAYMGSTGALHAPCGPPFTMETENCNGDTTFITTRIAGTGPDKLNLSLTPGPNYFDDYLMDDGTNPVLDTPPPPLSCVKTFPQGWGTAVVPGDVTSINYTLIGGGGGAGSEYGGGGGGGSSAIGITTPFTFLVAKGDDGTEPYHYYNIAPGFNGGQVLTGTSPVTPGTVISAVAGGGGGGGGGDGTFGSGGGGGAGYYGGGGGSWNGGNILNHAVGGSTSGGAGGPSGPAGMAGTAGFSGVGGRGGADYHTSPPGIGGFGGWYQMPGIGGWGGAGGATTGAGGGGGGYGGNGGNGGCTDTTSTCGIPGSLMPGSGLQGFYPTLYGLASENWNGVLGRGIGGGGGAGGSVTITYTTSLPAGCTM